MDFTEQDDVPSDLQVTDEVIGSNHVLEFSHRQVISVAVVDTVPERRSAVRRALLQLGSSSYATKMTGLPWVGNSDTLAKQKFDVVLVAVDEDQEAALETIKALIRGGVKTVVAYSQVANDDMLIRCMRLGVREFFYYPFDPGVLKEVFDRVANQSKILPEVKAETAATKSLDGKSFVFLGAKGGAGVTTAACNFAVSLARDSGRKTLLIDLDLPLGNAALNMGIASEFSTLDALNESDRLDVTFLDTLTVQHSSGLHVLAAPTKFRRLPIAAGAIDKLIEIAAEAFEYVVIDAGSRWDLAETRLFKTAATIYLVTQVGVAELRNSNRLIVELLQPYQSKIQIVLNRYTRRAFGIDEYAIQRALTRRAEWYIPNDYRAVLHMQNTAVPLVLKESAMGSAIEKMVRAASGPPQEKARKFKFFGLAFGT